ncbi:hypothetical protein [Pseudomonas phage Itty13]|uniref:NAD-specific glutamate dehydrogenase n=1 Tax=Pseudomonas phage Itty13 TaxID=2805750 RepID=A0A889IQY1_9CAUD|nr:hypothetical protein PQC19_gp03 [Pseudomonas phage Itty13]QRE00579.1 hypothetical protein [Pseudomonas phage Itty13]
MLGGDLRQPHAFLAIARSLAPHEVDVAHVRVMQRCGRFAGLVGHQALDGGLGVVPVLVVDGSERPGVLRFRRSRFAFRNTRGSRSRAVVQRGARELGDSGQQVADRRVQADDAHVLSGVALGEPLVMTVQHMAVAGDENGAVAAGELLRLGDLLGRELRLRRLQAVGWDGLLLVRDAARVQEVDHGAAMLGLDLRHLGSRHAQGAGVWREGGPLAVDVLAAHVSAGFVLGLLLGVGDAGAAGSLQLGPAQVGPGVCFRIADDDLAVLLDALDDVGLSAGGIADIGGRHDGVADLGADQLASAVDVARGLRLFLLRGRRLGGRLLLGRRLAFLDDQLSIDCLGAELQARIELPHVYDGFHDLLSAAVGEAGHGFPTVLGRLLADLEARAAGFDNLVTVGQLLLGDEGVGLLAATEPLHGRLLDRLLRLHLRGGLLLGLRRLLLDRSGLGLFRLDGGLYLAALLNERLVPSASVAGLTGEILQALAQLGLVHLLVGARGLALLGSGLGHLFGFAEQLRLLGRLFGLGWCRLLRRLCGLLLLRGRGRLLDRRRLGGLLGGGCLLLGHDGDGAGGDLVGGDLIALAVVATDHHAFRGLGDHGAGDRIDTFGDQGDTAAIGGALVGAAGLGALERATERAGRCRLRRGLGSGLGSGLGLRLRRGRGGLDLLRCLGGRGRLSLGGRSGRCRLSGRGGAVLADGRLDALALLRRLAAGQLLGAGERATQGAAGHGADDGAVAHLYQRFLQGHVRADVALVDAGLERGSHRLLSALQDGAFERLFHDAGAGLEQASENKRLGCSLGGGSQQGIGLRLLLAQAVLSAGGVGLTAHLSAHDGGCDARISGDDGSSQHRRHLGQRADGGAAVVGHALRLGANLDHRLLGLLAPVTREGRNLLRVDDAGGVELLQLLLVERLGDVLLDGAQRFGNRRLRVDQLLVAGPGQQLHVAGRDAVLARAVSDEALALQAQVLARHLD